MRSNEVTFRNVSIDSCFGWATNLLTAPSVKIANGAKPLPTTADDLLYALSAGEILEVEDLVFDRRGGPDQPWQIFYHGDVVAFVRVFNMFQAAASEREYLKLLSKMDDRLKLFVLLSRYPDVAAKYDNGEGDYRWRSVRRRYHPSGQYRDESAPSRADANYSAPIRGDYSLFHSEVRAAGDIRRLINDLHAAIDSQPGTIARRDIQLARSTVPFHVDRMEDGGANGTYAAQWKHHFASASLAVETDPASALQRPRVPGALR